MKKVCIFVCLCLIIVVSASLLGFIQSSGKTGDSEFQGTFVGKMDFYTPINKEVVIHNIALEVTSLGNLEFMVSINPLSTEVFYSDKTIDSVNQKKLIAERIDFLINYYLESQNRIFKRVDTFQLRTEKHAETNAGKDRTDLIFNPTFDQILYHEWYQRGENVEVKNYIFVRAK